MSLHDLAGNRHSQPESHGFTVGKKWIEDLILNFWWYSWTGISNLQHRLCGGESGRERKGSTALQRFSGVGSDIQYGSPHLVLVNHDQGRTVESALKEHLAMTQQDSDFSTAFLREIIQDLFP